MTSRSLGLIILAAIVSCIMADSAVAQGYVLSIPTNFGTGADAEVRESQTNIDLTGIPLGANRGDNDELASRASARTRDNMGTPDDPSDDTVTVNGNQSSAMYMKFDISGLPVSSDPFWNNKYVGFRGFTRNNGNFRAYQNDPSGNPTEYQLRLRALDPAGTYSTAQTDQNSNAYTASEYQYDWNELGITAFNAPGRTVFCADSNACNVDGTRGFYDEFDMDPNVLDIGHVPMPNPALGATLPAGHPLTFLDPGGTLTQLVKDARDLGLNHVTLIAHNDHDITDPNEPDGFFSHNHLLVPKEFADDAIQNGLDNSMGAFSPQLLVIPEPTSLLLISLASVLGLAARRRR